MRARIRMTLTSSLLLLVPSLLLLIPPPGSASARDDASQTGAAAGLVLETNVGAPGVGSGRAVLLRVTLRRAGTMPIEVLLPQHLGV